LGFGVDKGASIAFALERLGPISDIYGFDGFEGLPEDWIRGFRKGTLTVFVPRALKDLIVPGTNVIFEECWFVEDGFRALADFVGETGKKYGYLATTKIRAAVRFV